MRTLTRKAILENRLREVEREFTILQEVFSRIVEAQRTITIDMKEDFPEGVIRWNQVQTESGSKQMTIWFVPKENDRVENSNGQVPS